MIPWSSVRKRESFVAQSLRHDYRTIIITGYRITCISKRQREIRTKVGKDYLPSWVQSAVVVGAVADRGFGSVVYGTRPLISILQETGGQNGLNRNTYRAGTLDSEGPSQPAAAKRHVTAACGQPGC